MDAMIVYVVASILSVISFITLAGQFGLFGIDQFLAQEFQSLSSLLPDNQSSVDDVTRLLNDLLSDFNRNTRPVAEWDKPIDIGLDVSLRQIIELVRLGFDL